RPFQHEVDSGPVHGNLGIRIKTESATTVHWTTPSSTAGQTMGVPLGLADLPPMTLNRPCLHGDVCDRFQLLLASSVSCLHGHSASRRAVEGGECRHVGAEQ